MKVSVNIVIYNGLKYIKPCFDSIYNQTFKDFEIVVVDNNSSDESVNFIKENYPDVKLIESKENSGFARAHNQMIDYNNSEYVLVTNQDIILETDFIQKCVDFMDKNKEYGSCGGRLKKVKINENEYEGMKKLEIDKTNIIDCIGLDHTRGYRFFNIGEGVEDVGQFNESMDVFGVTGALALYRRFALDLVKDDFSYFDNRFFMYKEDIDLAWKLINKGFKARYISDAFAYHERGYSGEQKKNIDIINVFNIINRKNKDKEFLANLSYKNHLLILKKNLKKINIFIIYEEIKKGIYYLLFKTKIFFKTWKELLIK